MRDLELIQLRGEWTILRGPEVFYRTRHKDRADRLLPALHNAYDRGIDEGSRGWPEVPATSSPIYSEEGAALVEAHPRLDIRLGVYTSSSPVDREMALNALRRVLTLGARWAAHRKRQAHAEPAGH